MLVHVKIAAMSADSHVFFFVCLFFRTVVLA